MINNIERYKGDIKSLSDRANILFLALAYNCDPTGFKKQLGKDADEAIKKLPNFKNDYQSWYSEAVALIRQLLPDRLEDFKRHYEKPKARKTISFENYRIEDCLQGLVIKNGMGDVKAGPSSAIPHLEQQIAIVKAVERRFESALFDIKQLVQADMFDSELASAGELLRCGYLRAAGAICGVVLEKHLRQVIANHQKTITKKNPCINDYNELLKASSVIDVPMWRFIQRLGDIRNLCDHGKDREPSQDEIRELIAGVDKVIKSVF